MGLQSQLFRGDAKLEAAATSDPAHIVQGARGPHVGKIQQALIFLDGATIAPDSSYGPATAKAVLAYKTKRKIINTTYQNQPDNIVGKMTMASLDAEMLAAESLLSGPPRIDALLPGPTIAPPRSGPLVAFKVNGTGLLPQFPPLPGNVQIILGTPTPFAMELRIGGEGAFQVVNGGGGTVGCLDERIGLVFDPATPNAPGGTKPVSAPQQLFRVKGLKAGTTVIEARKPSTPGVLVNTLNIARIQLIVGSKATIAFHFLQGPPGIATQRVANVAPAVAKMNRIYTSQTNIVFGSLSDSGTPLSVPEFAQRSPGTGVNLKTQARTDDWKAITRFRNKAAFFNVFFVGKMNVDGRPDVPALTDNQASPQFAGRDCIMQDDLKGLEFGLALAHEAGHALGEPDVAFGQNLMDPNFTNEKIPPEMAKRMEANLAKP
jgi:peptidoglycan hydrolase-like protein with peptidoglycan-binding domain